MNSFRILFRYIFYFLTSVNKYSIHSPFVYTLLEEVIRKKPKGANLDKIEAVRADLLKDSTSIEVVDYGAGSKTDSGQSIKISSIAQHMAVERKYGRVLYNLTQHFKPNTMIELGTSLGLSSMYQAAGNPGGKLITMEGNVELADRFRIINKEQGITNIEVLHGPFDELLPKVLGEMDAVDHVFIDGNHTEEATLKYFNMFLKKIHPASVLIFDDIHWSAGMERAWKQIYTHEKVTCSIDIFQFGLVFFKEDMEKLHFVLRF